MPEVQWYYKRHMKIETQVVSKLESVLLVSAL